LESRKIYEALKKRIIWLDFKPESVLNLSELAQTFRVSRTPIKEVLIMLQAEGWVLRQGSHFMVTPLSLNRIKEMTEIRCVMEVQANVWAMNRITPEELAYLNAVGKEVRQLCDEATNKQMVELDVKFHNTLFVASKNTQLVQLLERLLSQYLRFWLAIPGRITRKSFFVETLEIIEAIEAKDEDRLRTASVAHIRRSMNEIMGMF
jgi:DNA-binding GntR family transcriptional regulator